VQLLFPEGNASGACNENSRTKYAETEHNANDIKPLMATSPDFTKEKVEATCCSAGRAHPCSSGKFSTRAFWIAWSWAMTFMDIWGMGFGVSVACFVEDG
jgi:hypothetical protein